MIPILVYQERTKLDMENKKCVDPFGREFESLAKMLNYHHIPRTTYYRYTKRGMSFTEILQLHSDKIEPTHDHLGNVFKSQNEMLNFYGISWSTHKYGIKKNMPLETILTKNRHKSTDHTGQTFKTFKEMCNEWGISVNSVKRRLKDGWSLEKALTEPQMMMRSFPMFVRTKEMKKHILIKEHICDEYFLCKIKDHEIIMTRANIIAYAEQIKTRQPQI